MTPLLAMQTEEVVVVALPILAVFIVGMTALITSHYRKLTRDDMEATLKMEMIQRGMSAEEIERVLAARFGEGSQSRAKGRAYAHGPAGAHPREA